MIKVIFLTAYLYCFLPLLIGTAAALSAKRRIGLPALYLSGYVIYLALFEILVALEMHRHASYTHLARYWELTICVLTVIALLCIGLRIIQIRRKDARTFKRNLSSESGQNIGLIHNLSRQSVMTAGFTLALIILAVLFLIPQAMDETPELARMSLASDTFFSLNPATSTAYADPSACPGLLHLFYAFGATMTGIDVTTLIHLIIPVFMIPLFVCVYITIGRILFPSEDRADNRFRFVWLIMLFYLLMLPLEAHVALAPYRNIWNGITLVASCLLPLFTAVCLDLSRRFARGDSLSATMTVHFVIGLICLGLATRLCVPFGFVICSLYVLAAIVIIVVGVVWRKRSGLNVSSNPEGGEPS